VSYRKRAGGGKRDIAEKPIVDALSAVSAIVIRHSGKGEPDLFVLSRGIWRAGEVKTDDGALTPAQVESCAGRLWPIWRTVDDALRAIGVIP
jgi:hypothetical protein